MCFILFVMLFFLWKIFILPDTPKSVEYVESTKEIYFHVAVDDDQTIHLVWQDDKYQLVYQQSKDYGKTWSEPFPVASDLDLSGGSDPQYQSAVYPYIITSRDTIAVFWRYDKEGSRRLSIDGGNTWGGQQTISLVAYTAKDSSYYGTDSTINGIEFIRSPEIGLYYTFPNGYTIVVNSNYKKEKNYIPYTTISREGDILYTCYRTSESIRYTKSNDLGLHWETPLHISKDKAMGSDINGPSATIHNDIIHVVWANSMHNPSGQTAGFINKLYYVRGYDMGNNWSDIREIDIDEAMPNHYSPAKCENPIIYVAGEKLIIAFNNNNKKFCCISSTDNGETWSLPMEIPGINLGGRILFPIDNNHIYEFGITSINRPHKWWAYIPFHFIVTWDANTEYTNSNDLYYSLIENGSVIKYERLTPPSSYVYGAIKSAQIGDSLIVFWKGKKDMEGYASYSKAPDQIFYEVLPANP